MTESAPTFAVDSDAGKNETRKAATFAAAFFYGFFERVSPPAGHRRSGVYAGYQMKGKPNAPGDLMMQVKGHE